MVYCAFTPPPGHDESCLNNAVFTDNVSLTSHQVMSTCTQAASTSYSIKLKHAFFNLRGVTSKLSLYQPAAKSCLEPLVITLASHNKPFPRLHCIQMGLLRSGRRGSVAVAAPVAVRSLNVEKNCSISFCSIWFRRSASSLARSAFRSLISAMVYFFLSWSSSSWRFTISVSSSRLRCSKLRRRLTRGQEKRQQG